MTGLKKSIRVLIAENSSAAANVLADIIKRDADIVLAGVATNGKEAIELTSKLKPDLIILDVDLPVIGGLEVTKQIMAYRPTPILVLSSSGFRERLPILFKAVSYGALEIWEKEFMRDDPEALSADLLFKIKFLAAIKVIHHPLAKLESLKEASQIVSPTIERGKAEGNKLRDRAVGIVTSTGGPAALLRVLKILPRDFPCPVFIVQHISIGFSAGLVEWLNTECEIEIKLASDAELINAGFVYIAPEKSHMRVSDERRIKLSDEPPCNCHKPSGDILMESVGKVYNRGAIGVILTGMGNDGSRGLQVLKEHGGITLAQDEKTSIVFGMPKAAIDLNIVDKVLSIDEIPLELIRLLKG